MSDRQVAGEPVRQERMGKSGPLTDEAQPKPWRTEGLPRAAKDDQEPERPAVTGRRLVPGGVRRDVRPQHDSRPRRRPGDRALHRGQPGADPMRKVSIIPRGRALGVTLSTPEQDRYGYDADYLRGRIIGALGGSAPEALVFGVTTTGAENDLEHATQIARSMVGRWGMSDQIGPVSVLPPEGNPRMAGVSDSPLDAVDQEVRRIIDETLDEPDAYAAVGIERVPQA